jgi:sugar transferase EpsL
MSRQGQNGWPLKVKQAVDKSLAAVGLVASAPVMAGCAVGVFLSMGRPVFFVQERPGKDGRRFRLVKFRTMREAVDDEGNPLPDSDRLTPVGKFLRATSLDELPQLWNILRGELSFVGPRPLLVRYLDRYTARQARRHEVLPGLTGWAQVNGRNALSWEEKFELDVWYVDHWSLGLDVKILIRTLGSVLRREGISGAGSATMTEFMGTKGKGQ